jgi:cold shock CspA family protein
MQLSGTLRSWNDDRGFGFISPTHGGAEIFVHISAFPRDGSRPVVGESLLYEPGRGKNGKRAAVRVIRKASRLAPPMKARPSFRPRPRLNGGGVIVFAVLAVGAGAYIYKHFNPQKFGPSSNAPSESSRVEERFECDGRTRCSQMKSCAEAKWFLEHCPGVEMDGDHDGIPCEQQLCGSGE